MYIMNERGGRDDEDDNLLRDIYPEVRDLIKD